MKPLLLLGMVVTMFTSCGTGNTEQESRTFKDTSFTVKGSILGLDSGYVYFQNVQSPGKNLDSVKVHHGQFSYTGRADTPTYYLLGIMNFGRMEYRAGFFAENTDFTISGRKDHSDGLKTTGGPVQEELNHYLEGKKVFEDERRKKGKSHDSLYIMKNFNGADSVGRLLEALDGKQKDWDMNYFKQHPNSLVSVHQIYQEYSYETNTAELETLYSRLSENMRHSYFGKKIAEVLDIAKSTSVGSVAPDFTLPDVNGRPIPLSSFRQRYVLIDFWAGWCGPCRMENPGLVKTWKRFHPKGFDILGVSLDENKRFWLSVIKEEGLPWTNVSDLKGFQSDAVLLYGVRAIPMNYLVDKEGRIVAKDLRSEALEKKLEEILK